MYHAKWSTNTGWGYLGVAVTSVLSGICWAVGAPRVLVAILAASAAYGVYRIFHPDVWELVGDESGVRWLRQGRVTKQISWASVKRIIIDRKEDQLYLDEGGLLRQTCLSGILMASRQQKDQFLATARTLRPMLPIEEQ